MPFTIRLSSYFYYVIVILVKAVTTNRFVVELSDSVVKNIYTRS